MRSALLVILSLLLATSADAGDVARCLRAALGPATANATLFLPGSPEYAHAIVIDNKRVAEIADP